MISRYLPPDAENVITRWNPQGVERLRRAIAAQPGPPRVCVAGTPRSGRTALVEELDALAPGTVDYTAPPTEASVVLMVLEPSAVLGRAELAVLDAATHSVGHVVFALTKIDAYRDWRRVRERDAALLARHRARFARVPLLPVSARLAARAREVGSDRGAVLRLESGITDLQECLAGALAERPERIRELGARCVAETVIEDTRRMITDTATALRAAADEIPLRAERGRLIAGRGGYGSDRIAQLRSQVQLAKVDLLHTVGNYVREALTAVRTTLDGAGRDDLEGLPDGLNRLSQEITGRTDSAVEVRLRELCTRVGAEPVPDPTTSSIALAADPEPRRRDIEDRMMIVVGASAGVGLGRLAVAPLTLVPALDMASIPATLALGGVAAWWLTRARRHLAERAHLRQWSAEALAGVRAQLEQRVLARLLEAEARVSESITAESRAQERAMEEALMRIDEELRRLAAQRSGRLASCERDLAVLARG